MKFKVPCKISPYENKGEIMLCNLSSAVNVWDLETITWMFLLLDLTKPYMRE